MNAPAKPRITLEQLRRFTPFDFLTAEGTIPEPEIH